MYTHPSPDDLIEGVIISLQKDIMPALDNPKAMATAAMAQAILQQVRQTIPRYAAILVEEHNAMTRVLRDVAAQIGETPGAEADRIRARAQAEGAREDYPAPLALEEVMDGHFACSAALVETLRDLDALQRAGDAAADAALGIVRKHLGPRYMNDVGTLIVGAGMVGRG